MNKLLLAPLALLFSTPSFAEKLPDYHKTPKVKYELIEKFNYNDAPEAQPWTLYKNDSITFHIPTQFEIEKSKFPINKDSEEWEVNFYNRAQSKICILNFLIRRYKKKLPTKKKGEQWYIPYLDEKTDVELTEPKPFSTHHAECVGYDSYSLHANGWISQFPKSAATALILYYPQAICKLKDSGEIYWIVTSAQPVITAIEKSPLGDKTEEAYKTVLARSRWIFNNIVKSLHKTK